MANAVPRGGTGGTWLDLGDPVRRKFGSSAGGEGIISLVDVLENQPAGDYYFRLVHRVTGGATSWNLSTLNTSVVGVALSTAGGKAFSTFKDEVATVDNATTSFVTASTNTFTAAGTQAFIHAQYGMSSSNASNAPGFQFTVSGGSVNQNINYRAISSSTDGGAGGQVGLMYGLTPASSYSAYFQSQSTGTLTLTTSNIIFCGFQLTDGLASATWDGSATALWETGDNWSGGVVPTSPTAVTIPTALGTYPIINGTTLRQCASLQIANGATLDIADDGSLTVAGNLTNLGTFTINSGATGTGSLIVEGTATGDVVMERYIVPAIWGTCDDGWHQISSPVADYDIELSDFTPTTNYDFYAWSEPDNLWINFKPGNDPSFVTVNGSDDFELGHGYMVAYEGTENKDFTGTINVSNVDITGLTTGTIPDHHSWHLLGNPFTSALTWYTGWTTSNIGGVAQIWNGSSKSYSAIAADEVIPATNGFMVYVSVSTGTGSLTIPKSKRVHDAQAFYKDSGYPLIKLKANNLDNPSNQESQIRFNPESTLEWDMEFDSDFLSGYAPFFYSQIGTRPLSVNSMPDYSENTVIPFTFIKNEGLNFSIEMYVVENMDMDVWLLDKKTNTEQNLSQNPIYIFSSFEGDNIERFEIRFKTVSIEEQDPTSSNIQIWASNKTINILNPEHNKGTIRIINMYGQLLIESQLTGNDRQELSVNISTGNYIVNVIGDNKVTSKKIFVK